MSYIFKITTESYLLTCSGEGAALIDADVVFHPTGFPMIPARRVKGMLKESLEEVLEIFGKSKQQVDATVSSLFGDTGTQTYQGKLLFHNLMLEGWDKIVEEIMDVPKDGFLQPDFIKSYFTTEVQQTAIGKEGKRDEIDGVAKKRSLRNCRVIKPCCIFEAPLSLTDVLTQEEEKYLKYAVLNLRHAGTRRNRGFGKIKCQLESQKADKQVQTEHAAGSQMSPEIIVVSINTLSPVVLADLRGEQNTVFTRKYISGSQLCGLLANAYIRSQGLAFGKAHHDPTFQELFVSGKIKFGDLRFKQGQVLPLHLHQFKRYPEKEPISVFAKSEDDAEITKSIGSIGQVHDGVIRKVGFSPKTTFNFHNSRPDRAAGRNTESDAAGGIFYYESLDEGQTFQGCITGELGSLNKLLAAFPASFKARLGRSRSAQYGFVEVSLEPNGQADNTKQLSPGEYVMSLQSPLILLNKWGFPSPTVGELEKEISKTWGVEEGQVKIENTAAAFTSVEQFNAVWRSKSGQVAAFKEGSSFLLKVFKTVDTAQDAMGEWTEQGFGRVKIEHFDTKQEYHLENNQDLNKDQSDSGKPIFTSAVLQKLQKAYDGENEKLEVKKKAIEEASSRSIRINNHLIGRMELLFERSSSAREIEEWINQTQSKPAGDALKKTGLVDYDHKFDLKIRDKDNEWSLQKLYWITFFQTLRKINKKDGKKR